MIIHHPHNFPKRNKQYHTYHEIADTMNNIKGNSCHPPCKGPLETADKNICNRTQCSIEQAINPGENAPKPNRLLLSENICKIFR
jgi:hypothetical protein